MRKKPRLVTNYRNFNTMTVQNKSSNYRKNVDKEALFCKKTITIYHLEQTVNTGFLENDVFILFI